MTTNNIKDSKPGTRADTTEPPLGGGEPTPPLAGTKPVERDPQKRALYAAQIMQGIAANAALHRQSGTAALAVSLAEQLMDELEKPPVEDQQRQAQEEREERVKAQREQRKAEEKLAEERERQEQEDRDSREKEQRERDKQDQRDRNKQGGHLSA